MSGPKIGFTVSDLLAVIEAGNEGRISSRQAVALLRYANGERVQVADVWPELAPLDNEEREEEDNA